MSIPKNAPFILPLETISKYNARIDKELYESTGEIFDERWNVIQKKYEGLVTEFQIKLAMSMNVNLPELCTEFQANLLISKKLSENKNG